MTETEAAAEVSRLKLLCPGVNEEQAMFWLREFMRHPVEVVQRALREIPRACGDFVDRPRLLSILDRISGPRDAKERRKAAEEEAARARTKAAAATGSIEDFWREVDAAMSRLRPEQLDQLKAQVLGELTPESRAFLVHRDPLKSPMLKAMIAKRLGIQEPQKHQTRMRIAT